MISGEAAGRFKPAVFNTPSAGPSEFPCFPIFSGSTINLFAKCSEKSSDENTCRLDRYRQETPP